MDFPQNSFNEVIDTANLATKSMYDSQESELLFRKEVNAGRRDWPKIEP
jgi:hypothetical protein